MNIKKPNDEQLWWMENQNIMSTGRNFNFILRFYVSNIITYIPTHIIYIEALNECYIPNYIVVLLHLDKNLAGLYYNLERPYPRWINKYKFWVSSWFCFFPFEQIRWISLQTAQLYCWASNLTWWQTERKFCFFEWQKIQSIRKILDKWKHMTNSLHLIKFASHQISRQYLVFFFINIICLLNQSINQSRFEHLR